MSCNQTVGLLLSLLLNNWNKQIRKSQLCLAPTWQPVLSTCITLALLPGGKLILENSRWKALVYKSALKHIKPKVCMVTNPKGSSLNVSINVLIAWQSFAALHISKKLPEVYSIKKNAIAPPKARKATLQWPLIGVTRTTSNGARLVGCWTICATGLTFGRYDMHIQEVHTRYTVNIRLEFLGICWMYEWNKTYALYTLQSYTCVFHLKNSIKICHVISSNPYIYLYMQLGSIQNWL